MQPGSRVQSKVDTSRRGVVTEAPLAKFGTVICRVQWDGSNAPTQCPLQAIEPIHESAAAVERVISGDFDPLSLLLARLTREKIVDPHSDVLYSLRTAAADFHPYQFRPVIKLIREDAGGILIADEVGLGKTIEAGYILKELKARDRSGFKRVLVVCPASLRDKWKQEMARRFGEHFEILGAEDLERLIDRMTAGTGDQTFQAIVSYETLRSKSCKDRVVELGLIDLTICDEAHHLRNPATLIYRVAKQLREATKDIVLLSATPIQMHSENLRALLALIASDRVQDGDGFRRQMAANQKLIQIERHILAAQPDDDAAACQLLDELRRGSLVGVPESHIRSLRQRLLDISTDDNVSVRVDLASDIRDAGPFSTILTRTRRRDVRQNFSKRRPMMVDVAFTTDERVVFDWCLAESRRRYAEATDSIGRFVCVNVQRKFSSSIRAFLGALAEDIADECIEGADDSPSTFHTATLVMPTEVAHSAHALLTNNVDTKYACLCSAMQSLIEADPSAKFVIFSFYKGTLAYLNRRLTRDGLQVVQIDGDVPSHPQRPSMDERGNRIKRFREDPDVRVLLSSEVGSEGLDFQDVCYVVVNYDLPWNPMRIEQRIGRVDRYGQTREAVIIVNFKVRDTIEDRVYHQLLERINIFHESIGDLEEILGDVQHDVEELVMLADTSGAQPENFAADGERIAATMAAIARQVGESQELLVEHGTHIDETLKDIDQTGRRVLPSELANFVESALRSQDLHVLPGYSPRRTIAPSGRAMANVIRRQLRLREEAAMNTTITIEAGPCTLQYEDPKVENYVDVTHPIVTACVNFSTQSTNEISVSLDREFAASASCRVPDAPSGVSAIGVFRLTTVTTRRSTHAIEFIVRGPDGGLVPRPVAERMLDALRQIGADAARTSDAPRLSTELLESIHQEVGERLRMAEEIAELRQIRTRELSFAKDRAKLFRVLESAQAQIEGPDFKKSSSIYQRLTIAKSQKAEDAIAELDRSRHKSEKSHIEIDCIGYIAVRNEP